MIRLSPRRAACLLLPALLTLFTLPALGEDLIAISPVQREAMGIRSTAVTPATESWSVAFPAQVVVPTAQLRVVSTPLSGLLSMLQVAEGDRVRKGQPLAMIQSPGLIDLQRSYLQALSRLDLARADVERDRQLLDEGIIAERRYQTSHARFVQARTEVEQGQQTLQLAGMDASELKRLADERQLSGTLVVRSPIAGVVLARMATPGQRLNALDPLYRIGSLKPLWLEIHVPLERLSQTSPGGLVAAVSPPVRGRVITIGRKVHSADQGVLVRAEVREGVEQLYPGQYVEVKLARSSTEHNYRIPLSALLRHAGKTWVFVVQEGGFLAVPVRIHAEENNAVVVSGDISAGEQVVVSGTAALKAAWLEGGE